MVPSPNVAEDHQLKNAQSLVEKDAAILVKDNEAKEKLVAQFLELARNDNRMVELAVNIQKLAKPQADDLIVEEVYKLITK